MTYCEKLPYPQFYLDLFPKAKAIAVSCQIKYPEITTKIILRYIPLPDHSKQLPHPNLRSPQGNQLTTMAPPPNTTTPTDTKTPANPTNSVSRQQEHSTRTEIHDASDQDSIQVEIKQYSALDRIKMEREDEKAHPKEPLYPAKGIWKSRLCAIPALLLFGCGGG